MNNQLPAETEIWVPIDGFEDYLISNKGGIKSNRNGNIPNPDRKPLINHKDGICAYPDRNCMEEQLMNDEWHTAGDKHYCPSCWYMDDEDNIQLKPAEWSGGKEVKP